MNNWAGLCLQEVKAQEFELLRRGAYVNEHEPEDKKAVSDDYEVGYGRPPKASQFRKGQSGNPRGRPKNAKSFKTFLTTALREKVTVSENGDNRRSSKREAAAIQLANSAAMGDLRALRVIMDLLGELEEREEQIYAATAGSTSRERIEARLNQLAERIRTRLGLPPEELAPIVTSTAVNAIGDRTEQG